MKTKDRILDISIELFNRNGVVAVTTNHIAKEMSISPGNLYFHYDNKEEIILELFKRMCKETYQIWRPKRSLKTSPMEFVDENFEVYWKYRFFHREMYSIRRKDPSLSKMWKIHVEKMMKHMRVLYRHWVEQGKMTKVKNDNEMLYVFESLLAMATTFLQFFESTEKTTGRKSIDRGKTHVARLLLPYTIDKTRDEFENFINSETIV
ncbi:MAG: TetR/AcrR family transcriptional regulator [Deltaproteobacteria bacterium]|jgi:AcrR family transcriptional regulator|nr:TetR/AcrR family transcriptional regulator [Deltaproteobacteria bacterium]